MSAPDTAPLHRAIGLLRDMYACQDNEARGKLTLQLLQFETTLTAAQASFVGIELLKTTSEGPAVQAYGGVILKHALSKNLLRADSLPFWDLLAWYSNEPTLGNLLCSTLTELFVEYIVRLEGDRSVLIDQLIDGICSEAELSKHPRHIYLLFAIVTCFSVPDFEHLPANLAVQLGKEIRPYFPRILKAVVQALSDFYAAAGGAAQYPPGTERAAEDCVMIVGHLGTQVSGDVWAAVGLQEALEALLQWPPARKVSIAATTMLLRASARLDAAQEGRVRQLLVSLLGFVEQCVEANALTTIDELLDMLQTLPKPLVRSISVQLCYPLLCILRIPSLMFVNIVCTLLLQLDEGAFATMNVLDLYAAFRRLLPKNLFHPDTGTAPEGVALSQQQLGFAGLYDQVFAEVRGHAGKLLSVTAKLNPSATNQYVLKLLTDLCPPQGTAEDERTVAGFVTHRSATFTSWECTQFMLSHLFGAFPLCSDYVPECIQALREREPTDAVLQPLYFNMLSYFWTYTGVDALNVWVATLDILFNCVEERARDRRDPDVSAARRRALTLLISVSMEHAAKFVSLVPAVVKRTEALLFSTRTSTEKSLLYESLASFLTCLPVEDADSYLESLLKPVLSILEQHITPWTRRCSSRPRPRRGSRTARGARRCASR
ncbi:hypothetical protein STCU_09750 [Strigomonas culicis]|uniref:Uncharacterized protein n=1 Tax=Strigomonas culicis TaxID=28005 RepID=S9UWB8_9TRYP|nr:hypothetical protein STCU_09750 [Strigomonas culicis]|eukprot:EPY18836.1 hypothetical protein STCU_09750 [Strigomonas culicis]